MTPHTEPLLPRTTHRPTLRWGDGARTPRSVSPAPSPPGWRTGNLTALNLHLLFLLRGRRLRRDSPAKRRMSTEQVPCPLLLVVSPEKEKRIPGQITSGRLHSRTVIARAQAATLPRVVCHLISSYVAAPAAKRSRPDRRSAGCRAVGMRPRGVAPRGSNAHPDRAAYDLAWGSTFHRSVRRAARTTKHKAELFPPPPGRCHRASCSPDHLRW